MRRKNHTRKDEEDSVAQRLRSERPEATPLELDRIKTTAMSRARPMRALGGARRRFAVAGLTIGLMAAGTGGVIAGGVTSTSPENAATAEYGHSQEGGGVLGSKHHQAPTSHRHITIHLNVPHRAKLTKVTVLLNGKVLFVLKGNKASSSVQLSGLPCGKRITTIEIIAVQSNGSIIRETRQFRLCQYAALGPYGHQTKS
jgi:hypothetical protein